MGFRALRNVIVSFSVAGILPLINHLGISVAYGIMACIAWVGFGYVTVQRHGQGSADVCKQSYLVHHPVRRENAGVG